MNEVQSFVLEEQGIRGAVVRLRETWLQVVAQHNYPAQVSALLGQAVAATALLANGLKDRPRLSIQLNGDGPLKLLLTQCSEDLRVRGMAQWQPLDAAGPLLGQGRLTVNVDTGRDNGFFQGIVPLVGPGLRDCLQAYFAQSEQLPTRILLFADERQVAGLILQALPARDTDANDFAAAAAFAETVTADELFTARCDILLPHVFAGYAIRLFEPRAVLHDCRCTPERLASVARMLGHAELESLLLERGRVELTCEFCNRAFRYSRADIESVLEGNAPRPPVH